jgi:UDPglucose 6-dehydrogenase
MRISILGTGHVGLVAGACLAEIGHQVICYDIDKSKICNLAAGDVQIYEPTLDELIQNNLTNGRISFTTDISFAIGHSSLIIIAVGTPCYPDGTCDISQLTSVAQSIGRNISGYKLVVNKTTAPVGTADHIARLISQEIVKRTSDATFHVAVNPEFLREGSAVNDFLRPDRVIFGSATNAGEPMLRELYEPLKLENDRIIFMDSRSAELTKYAANAILAARIGIINEFANLADSLGANIDQVRSGIGADSRIGHHYLQAGIGFGGSCLPKDLRCLNKMGKDVGLSLPIIEATKKTNLNQREIFIKRLLDKFAGNICGKKFAIWGLAFKPGTNDMRESVSLYVINEICARGGAVQVYDPAAMSQARSLFKNRDFIRYSDNPMDALVDADALLVLTEWPEFRRPNFDAIRNIMRRPLILDGRNALCPAEAKNAGIEYSSIGRMLLS